MSEQTNISYKQAGVDTEKGQEFVQNIKERVASTFSQNVIGGLGGFAACYDVSFLKDYKTPILLSGTDGVGTKLEIARLLDKHDTIGIDLVAMCANDILVNGGKSLFFQDYIACGKLNVARMEKIVSGIVDGCLMADCSLVGGETAEHPGVMEADEYDLAGFVVGVVEKDKLIDGRNIQVGDKIIGLKSSGPHSNGFSLLRKLLMPNGKLPSGELLDFITRDVFVPTRIYVKPILKLIETEEIKGMVHITGGGFYENIPRVLPKGLGAEILSAQIPRSTVFERLKEDFHLEKKDLFSTFNMGVGFILVVSDANLSQTIAKLNSLGETAFPLGTVNASGRIDIL
ncbi:phosphoribosylaminoimidazole synthetase [Leptospira ryugenii]|uniref:Phosphoribosylformylglycinamidine cyclo-ligase n=1 Tax=Leptospira ryugenii TaxID=1917863 RepID=A0A2P2E0Y4_9LEPT|nr:phosphoribosylformylglycinamidine cyclo-ligase [Leptospira ryugenii]GBF50534.1 phosphoribosylaminoimidazole synthetase [Leptospira ryugenii]